MKVLQQFIDNSPSSYQATENITRKLEKNGFKNLDETKKWELNPGGSYYIVRNMSSVIAFRMGREENLQLWN